MLKKQTSYKNEQVKKIMKSLIAHRENIQQLDPKDVSSNRLYMIQCMKYSIKNHYYNL